MSGSEAKVHQWNLSDTITALRIAASVLLLFFSRDSVWFLSVYTFAGLTDVLDGWLARRTGTASEFGARLDSIADLIFYGVLLSRIFPDLWEALPMAIWYTVAVIVFVRLAAYAAAAIRYRQFAALHTWLNKLTGIAVFLLPYVLTFTSGVAYSWAVCILAFVAAAQELAIHLFRRVYC